LLHCSGAHLLGCISAWSAASACNSAACSASCWPSSAVKIPLVAI